VMATRLVGYRPRIVVDGISPRGGRRRPQRQPLVLWTLRSRLTTARTFYESTCSCSAYSPRHDSQVPGKT
jgi:hypothetical protein